SPTCAWICVSRGTVRSVREPKRMSPKRSPASSLSPGPTRQTIRRASTPAIWVTATRTFSPWRWRTHRSLRSDASDRYGGRKRPGPTSMRPRAMTPGTATNGHPSRATFMLAPCRPAPASAHPGWFDPAHHRAQTLPHLLDGMVGFALAHREEAGPVGLVLQDPLAREGPRLDLAEDLLHLGLGRLPDHA